MTPVVPVSHMKGNPPEFQCQASDHEPPGQRIALIPACANAVLMTGEFSTTLYQDARFIPSNLSVTGAITVDSFTVTVLSVETVMAADVPLAELNRDELAAAGV